jgi:hypothetical protein
MEIINNNDLFEVRENGEVLYAALTEEEAQGYIEWSNRSDAGIITAIL